MMDNNLNIRGVGNLVDRGTAVLVVNTEYRHTVVENSGVAVQTNVFVDAGNWRSPGGEFKELFTVKKTRVHSGIGLRFIYKKIYNTILRIDYGLSIANRNEKGFVFGIGQYF